MLATWVKVGRTDAPDGSMRHNCQFEGDTFLLPIQFYSASFVNCEMHTVTEIDVRSRMSEFHYTLCSLPAAIRRSHSFVWLGGAVVRALDLRLEVAGLIPAAALSSATLDKLFTHIVQRL